MALAPKTPQRLVIAPHIDDDVIGCGGILDMNTCVFYLGVDAFHRVARAGRFNEATALAQRTGHIYELPNADEFPVNQFRPRLPGLIRHLEEAIKRWQPLEVLLPWPSYNQDHQTVYDAAMVALRPHDENHFVPRVLLYEEPDCFWPGIREPFRPTLFRPIDIDEKIARYELMPSQVRGHRAPDHLRALAVVRGAAIMKPAAEAYHIVRWVE